MIAAEPVQHLCACWLVIEAPDKAAERGECALALRSHCHREKRSDIWISRKKPCVKILHSDWPFGHQMLEGLLNEMRLKLGRRSGFFGRGPWRCFVVVRHAINAAAITS
jgi:hypothetical protein